MKYIYSFWSKPFLNKINEKEDAEAEKILKKFIKLQRLSFNAVETISDNIELITDDFGAEILQEIKFKKIKKDLNAINKYHSDFWAVGKLYSISLYEEPVCHIDYDFIIKDSKTFREIVNTNWDILGQSKEINPSYDLNYKEAIRIFLDLMDYRFKNIFPEFSYFDLCNYTINCGVLGFKHLNAKKEYVNKSLKIFDYFNELHLNKTFYNKLKFYCDRHEYFSVLNINSLIEQFYLSLYANYNNFYFKEICPISQWEQYNNINKKLNNYQNETSTYKHYVGEEKNLTKIETIE